VSDLIRQAAQGGADLVCLPEMFCCPYETQNFPLYAEEEGGAVWQTLSSLARENRVILSAGSVPEKDGAAIYNTAYVFDRNGSQIAKHRKTHLFDIDVKGGQRFMESETLTKGDHITVFDTEFGKMGLCVCYDIRFPELIRSMALSGAQLILVPAAFNTTTGPAHWELTFRAQAVLNQVFIAGTSPARDMDYSYHAWGHSLICDPWGTVLSEMDETEGMRLTKIDLSRAAEVRAQLPLTDQRRTDLYRLDYVSPAAVPPRSRS